MGTLTQHPIRKSAEVKEKKSFTLSSSSVNFLKQLRQEKKAPSTSIVLEELIQEADAVRRRRAAEQAISEYYSNLSASEEKELREWGEFSMEQLKPERD